MNKNRWEWLLRTEKHHTNVLVTGMSEIDGTIAQLIATVDFLKQTLEEIAEGRSVDPKSLAMKALDRGAKEGLYD